MSKTNNGRRVDPPVHMVLSCVLRPLRNAETIRGETSRLPYALRALGCIKIELALLVALIVHTLIGCALTLRTLGRKGGIGLQALAYAIGSVVISALLPAVGNESFDIGAYAGEYGEVIRTTLRIVWRVGWTARSTTGPAIETKLELFFTTRCLDTRLTLGTRKVLTTVAALESCTCCVHTKAR